MISSQTTNLKSMEKEEMHRQITEYSLDTTVIHSGYKILHINKQGAELLGTKQEKLIGTNITEVFTETSRAFIIERIRQGEEEQKIGELVEVSVYRTDGAIVDVELFCHPVKYGETKAVQSILRDITLRKQLENELSRVMTPLIPILNGIAILPLVGTIQASRTEQLLDGLGSKLQKDALQYLIIDVSGVNNINRHVVDLLNTIVKMLESMGISPICVGIRPELACKIQLTYSDNVLTQIPTMSSVTQAIKYVGR